MPSSKQHRRVPPRRSARGEKTSALTRRLLCCGLFLSGMTAASAQVRPTDQISRCTLITDPTAQRACIESSTASRPSASFDPTVRPPQAPRPPGRERDAPTAKATIDAGPAASAAKAGGGTYRDTNWRLQIP